MSDLPILYSFRRCPYAIRARMALAAAGAEVMLREVLLKDKPPELVAASPKATVPVLVLSEGQVIEESLDGLERIEPIPERKAVYDRKRERLERILETLDRGFFDAMEKVEP